MQASILICKEPRLGRGVFSPYATWTYRGRTGCHMSAHHRIRRSSPSARECSFNIRHAAPALYSEPGWINGSGIASQSGTTPDGIKATITVGTIPQDALHMWLLVLVTRTRRVVTLREISIPYMYALGSLSNGSSIVAVSTENHL
jgi:hypothetical protein